MYCTAGKGDPSDYRHMHHVQVAGRRANSDFRCLYSLLRFKFVSSIVLLNADTRAAIRATL